MLHGDDARGARVGWRSDESARTDLVAAVCVLKEVRLRLERQRP